MKNIIAFLIISFCFSSNVYSQIDNFKLYPLINNDISQIINSIPDTVEVIGLGESSHYTKEYYTYRDSIIKELIENDFKLLLFEVDYGTAYEWNNYVNHGLGNIDTILYNCPWWTYSTVEFKAVIETIKNYNSTNDDKINIFGIEMTYLEKIFPILV